jgi:hypothetical protein
VAFRDGELPSARSQIRSVAELHRLLSCIPLTCLAYGRVMFLLFRYFLLTKNLCGCSTVKVHPVGLTAVGRSLADLGAKVRIGDGVDAALAVLAESRRTQS